MIDKRKILFLSEYENLVHFLGKMRKSITCRYNKEGYATAVFSSLQELFSTPFSKDPGPLYFAH